MQAIKRNASITRAAPWAMVAILFGVLSWMIWPYFLLWQVERTLSAWYGEHRPFPYRWVGAPHGSPKAENPAWLDDETFGIADGRLKRAEKRFGATARILRLRSRNYLLAGPLRSDQAVASYYRAIALNPDDSGLLAEFAAALALRGSLAKRSVDYALALDTMMRAIESSPPPEALFDAAVLFDELPLRVQAIDLWERALRSEKTGPWREESAQRLAKAQAFLANRKKQVEKVSAFPPGMEDEIGATDLALTAAVEHWLPARGEFESELRRLASAMERKHQDHWLTDILQIPDSPQAAEAFLHLAAACHGNSSNDGAGVQDEAAQAEDLFKKIRSPGGALRARIERVYALNRDGDPQGSRKLLEGIRPQAEANSWTWLRDQAWLEELSRSALSRTVDTLKDREDATKEIPKDGYEGLRIRLMGFLTSAHMSLTTPMTAWSNGIGGIQEYWRGVLPPVRVHVFYYALARDAHARGLEHAAVSLMREAVKATEQTGFRSVLAYELSDLGTYEMLAGESDQASKTFERTQQVFTLLSPQKLSRFVTLAEIHRADAETIAGRPEEALRILQKADGEEFAGATRLAYASVKGHALLRKGAANDAVREFDSIIVPGREQLGEVHDPVQRAGAFLDLGPAFRGLTEAQLTLGQTEKAVETWHQFRGRSSKEIAGPHPPPGMALLTLAVLHRGVSVWFVDSSGVTQQWIDAKEIAHAAQQFAELAADPDSSLAQLHVLARQLDSVILDPFRSRFAGISTLVIDADGALAKIPWLALEDNRGRALVEKVAIVQSMGWAEVARSQANAAPARYEQALIVDNPALDKEMADLYPPLTDARDEVDELHLKLPRAQVISRENANADALLQHLPSVNLFHFAGHGISHGGFGALLLAPKAGDARAAMLTADEISRLHLSPLHLVFLSACSTAVGEYGTVNLDGLVRAFLEAGAERVVGARWDVDSATARLLARGFYDGLLRGVTPARALQQTAVALRKSKPHPYYWAAFQLYGAP